MKSKNSNVIASATLAACVVFAVGMLLQSPSAEARPRPAGKSKMSSFEANKTFGLGVMLGAPTGLSGKYFLSADTALDFGLGTIYGYRDRRGFHIHGDFLYLDFNGAFGIRYYFN